MLAIAPLAALWGPSAVTRASGRCLDVVRVLRITQGAPAVEAVALSCQGVLEALRGRTEAAIGFRVRDHRKLGWGDTLRDADTFLHAQLALSELSPDWRYRIDHHRARGRVQLGRQAQVGTREGGAFENLFLVVAVYDEAGLVLGIDTYDVDQLDQARTRFEELAGAQGSSAALDPVETLFFEPEDRAAAHDELFERYVAMGADGLPRCAIEWLRAVNAHDLVRARGAMADDFVLDDYRRTGMGRLEGADVYIDALAALYELIPDARLDALHIVAAERHGRVTVNRTWGHNAEGGKVESLLVALVHQTGEKLSRIELLEVEHLDDALVRLAEIGSGRTNAATRARELQAAAFVAQDWDAIRRLATADFVYEDRGKRALVTGDVEAWVASMQFTSQPGFRPSVTLIGMFGDRVALDRVVWSGEPGGDAFEFERIRVLEADAEGRMRAVIMFDPEDQLQATNEALTRFAAAESAEPVRGLVAWGEAQRAKRWDDMEGALACFDPPSVSQG